MLRPYLVLLLLLNYLLVVGAGLVARPAQVVERPFDYEHKHDCQLINRLRVGCFDSCNGVQYQVKKQGERPTLSAVLSALKAVDAHCLPQFRELVAVTRFPRVVTRTEAGAVGIPTGYRGQVDLPPCRG